MRKRDRRLSHHLNDPEIDAVKRLHAQSHAQDDRNRRSARRKHVLCEKPAAPAFTPEALEMQKVQHETGKILNIGVVNRFATSVNEVRRRIMSPGELGEVYHVFVNFRCHRSIPGIGGAFTTKAISGGGVAHRLGAFTHRPRNVLPRRSSASRGMRQSVLEARLRHSQLPLPRNVVRGDPQRERNLRCRRQRNGIHPHRGTDHSPSRAHGRRTSSPKLHRLHRNRRRHPSRLRRRLLGIQGRIEDLHLRRGEVRPWRYVPEQDSGFIHSVKTGEKISPTSTTQFSRRRSCRASTIPPIPKGNRILIAKNPKRSENLLFSNFGRLTAGVREHPMKNIRRVHQRRMAHKGGGVQIPGAHERGNPQAPDRQPLGDAPPFPAVLHSQRDTVRSRDRILKKRKVRRREGEHREQHADQAEQRKKRDTAGGTSHFPFLKSAHSKGTMRLPPRKDRYVDRAGGFADRAVVCVKQHGDQCKSRRAPASFTHQKSGRSPKIGSARAQKRTSEKTKTSYAPKWIR